jgi:hypothetical protein
MLTGQCDHRVQVWLDFSGSGWIVGNREVTPKTSEVLVGSYTSRIPHSASDLAVCNQVRTVPMRVAFCSWQRLEKLVHFNRNLSLV